MASATDGDGHVTHFGYDADGRQTSQTLPSGDQSAVAYDAAGEVTSSTDAAGKTTSYSYDGDGRLASETDPLNRVTGLSYTADNQVQSVTLPDSSTESAVYNANGQTTQFTNADGANTTYQYDDSGLLTGKSEPGGLASAYSYTTAGFPHVETNPDGTTISDSYNAGGLLTGVDYSGSSAADTTFAYDADNLRTSMTDATGTSTYGYDSRGLMTSETDGNAATIGYGYDDAGQLTSITYPGNTTVNYGYDAAGQMTSLTDWGSNQTDFTWTNDGQLASQADPNGITQTRTYDADDRTIGISTANASTTLANYAYGYDDAGELASDSTTDPNTTTASTHTYTHNALSQLTTVATATTSSSYAQTPAGSMTLTTAGSTMAYNSAEQVTSSTPGAGPSTTFAYDSNGDRTSSTVGATSATAAATTTYGYDPAGDLASVAIPSFGSSPAETVHYTSDGDGLRQSRTVGSSTSHFVWSNVGSLPLLLDDGTWSYLYGPSSAPIAQINDSTGTIRYLTGDLVGSTRLITSSAGSVLGVNVYDEYGNLTSHTGSVSSRFGYSGNWTDPDTGLVYLRARDYDPATAQFLSVDPLVDSTRQPYAYVADDPLARTDPTGRDWITDGEDAVARALMNGPLADGASVLEGIGDGVTGGLTGVVRRVLGTDCQVQRTGYYVVGAIAGAVVGTVLTAGLGAGAEVGDAGAVAEEAGSEVSDIAMPMNSETESGAAITHSQTATAIGDDPNTIQNFLRSKGVGGHDVIVHGDADGNFRVNGLITHPQQIADAILANPAFRGQRINLVTCYGVRGMAGQLSQILGVSVHALDGKVDLNSITGVLQDVVRAYS